MTDMYCDVEERLEFYTIQCDDKGVNTSTCSITKNEAVSTDAYCMMYSSGNSRPMRH